MLKLSFPNYEFRLKKINQKRFIFDEVRKKFVELTPEEWVRQNCIRYLEKEKKFNKSLIAVEKKVNLNNTTKRFDILTSMDIFYKQKLFDLQMFPCHTRYLG